MKTIRWLSLALAAFLLPAQAHAFCGFYVGSERTSLFNDKTMVVLMRRGTTTVLSMQNNYQGPPERFAMVVPVPTVLSEANVRTLPDDVFERVHTLASPRLVEYWERDPCERDMPMADFDMQPRPAMRAAVGQLGALEERQQDLGVRVEARFDVAEYDIAILSARDSSGLDTWLRQEGYHIPAGAERALRPYVQQGTKFFVARVDPSRVTFQSGRAMLSPLRVHYESDTFSLPVRLGLINSSGSQDLLVHVLAPNQRYEVANYPNALIPTNLPVRGRTLREFGSFYESLFDKTMEVNPGAVVTEYSWQSTSCDPCPGPTLNGGDIMTLGADVVGGGVGGWTLTRLHYRYGRRALDEDLVFRPAPAIQGGNGSPTRGGMFTRRVSQSSGINMFQGRYAVMHRWRGAVECSNPVRGRWDGRPRPNPMPRTAAPPQRGRRLSRYLHRSVPELSRGSRGGGGRGAEPGEPLGPTAWKQSFQGPSRVRPSELTAAAALGGCAVTNRSGPLGALAFLALAGAVAVIRRRQRKGPGHDH